MRPPAESPDFHALLRRLDTQGQLVHLERLPPREAVHAQPRRPLHPALAERLPPLWKHQADAIDLVRAGRSTAIATGTASGKTLCYVAPIAEAVLADPADATALCLYPTKALAQDQLRAIGALDVPGLVVATYDGDTDPDHRSWVRRNANVVLTNPDMLHAGILASHARWATFLMRLRYVVVDELHTLRGIFGTHVAHVLRRLRRLCALYGAAPTFVFGSATVGAPGRLASLLCGHDVAEVTDDGSPRGERVVAVWNPPPSGDAPGARRSALHETAALLAGLVAGGARTIAFTRSRKGAEVVAAGARRLLGDGGAGSTGGGPGPPATVATGADEDARLAAQTGGLAGAVRPYRAGYLAHERREIEAQLFDGRLRGVSATSALELGIDVGGLDACILNGFPGTIASFWQQVGRAGRSAGRSLAVLVAGADALDQWFANHPAELFRRPPEPVIVNPSNPFVLDAQLACAAYEQPLTPGDEQYWGDDMDDGVRRLVIDDELRLREGRAVYAGRDRPSASVGLRTGTSSEVSIVDGGGSLIGTVDRVRAFTSVHPGAVYLHQGQHYRVVGLDLDEQVAWVAPTDGEETTQARSTTTVRILDEERHALVGRARLALGTVEVTDRVTGYRRRSLLTGESLGDEELDLPPAALVTRAFWYTFDERVLGAAGVAPRRWPGTLHAAEHAGIGMLPLFTICDRWDVGGVSTPLQAETGLPTIVVYDGYPGGAGIAELGFDAGARHVAATLEAIEGCRCTGGCPSCVQSPKCGNLNDPLDKTGAIELLRAVLG